MHDITSLRSVCFGEINPRNLRPNQVQRETGSFFCAQVPGLAQGWQGTLSTSSGSPGRTLQYTRAMLSSDRFVKPRLKFPI